MTKILAQASDTVSVQTGSIYSWVNIPMAVALVFALAGSFFVVIYFLRRSRADKKQD